MIVKSYKFRLFPTKSQERALSDSLEICRLTYNKLLGWRKTDYELKGKTPGYYEQQNALPLWKKEDTSLKILHSHVLQNVCKRVDLAYSAFFRRLKSGENPGYPRFKGKGYYDSLTYTQFDNGFYIQNDKLKLSKIGSLKMKTHRPIEGNIKTVTIRRSNGKWYACFSVESDLKPLPHSSEAVGIDVGLKSFAVLSTGEAIQNPRFFKSEKDALAKAQRKLVRQKNGSRERKRAKKVVARIHERISDRRKDFIHKTTHHLVKRFGKIYVEKLDIPNIVEKNTREPAYKSKPANRSIADVAWGMFRNILNYKAGSAGREYAEINPAYTTQICSRCGHRQDMPLSKRTFRCKSCNLVIDRDYNSSLNIVSLGLQGVTGFACIEAL